MANTLLEKVKAGIRRTHNKLDDDLRDDIDACLADLASVGVIYADVTDPLIVSAVKNYCRSTNTDDPAKAAEWLRRYESQKASLMMAEGYGREAGADE
jgi:hypothetical protein